MTTIFEARFYCQFFDSDYIYHLGNYGSKIYKTREEIETGKTDDLIQWLFTLLPKLNPTIPFQYDVNMIHNIWFEQNDKKDLIIYLFAGYTKPTYEILNFSSKLSKIDNRKVVLYQYKLSQGSQFYASNKKFFLMLLNHLLKNLNIQEHNRFLEGKYYLRFLYFHNELYINPGTDAYFREIKDALPDHQKALNLCPSTHLPCEMNTLYLGHFLFIPKEKWLNRTEFTLQDLITGD